MSDNKILEPEVLEKTIKWLTSVINKFVPKFFRKFKIINTQKIATKVVSYLIELLDKKIPDKMDAKISQVVDVILNDQS
jgi:hypothetical protein